MIDESIAELHNKLVSIRKDLEHNEQEPRHLADELDSAYSVMNDIASYLETQIGVKAIEDISSEWALSQVDSGHPIAPSWLVERRERLAD